MRGKPRWDLLAESLQALNDLEFFWNTHHSSNHKSMLTYHHNSILQSGRSALLADQRLHSRMGRIRLRGFRSPANSAWNYWSSTTHTLLLLYAPIITQTSVSIYKAQKFTHVRWSHCVHVSKKDLSSMYSGAQSWTFWMQPCRGAWIYGYIHIRKYASNSLKETHIYSNRRQGNHPSCWNRNSSALRGASQTLRLKYVILLCGTTQSQCVQVVEITGNYFLPVLISRQSYVRKSCSLGHSGRKHAAKKNHKEYRHRLKFKKKLIKLRVG